MNPLSPELAGKRLQTVLLFKSEASQAPVGQLFLCFDDGTSYEFFSMAKISPASRPDPDAADEVLRKVRPDTKLVSRVDQEPGPPRDAHPDRDLATVAALLKVENEIVFAIEALASEHGSEVKEAIHDARRAVSDFGVPIAVRKFVTRNCDEAYSAWVGAGDHRRECLAILKALRKHLADEIASVIGSRLPY